MSGIESRKDEKGDFPGNEIFVNCSLFGFFSNAFLNFLDYGFNFSEQGRDFCQLKTFS